MIIENDLNGNLRPCGSGSTSGRWSPARRSRLRPSSGPTPTATVRSTSATPCPPQLALPGGPRARLPLQRRCERRWRAGLLGRDPDARAASSSTAHLPRLRSPRAAGIAPRTSAASCPAPLDRGDTETPRCRVQGFPAAVRRTSAAARGLLLEGEAEVGRRDPVEDRRQAGPGRGLPGWPYTVDSMVPCSPSRRRRLRPGRRAAFPSTSRGPRPGPSRKSRFHSLRIGCCSRTSSPSPLVIVFIEGREDLEAFRVTRAETLFPTQARTSGRLPAGSPRFFAAGPAASRSRARRTPPRRA